MAVVDEAAVAVLPVAVVVPVVVVVSPAAAAVVAALVAVEVVVVVEALAVAAVVAVVVVSVVDVSRQCLSCFVLSYYGVMGKWELFQEPFCLDILVHPRKNKKKENIKAVDTLRPADQQILMDVTFQNSLRAVNTEIHRIKM